MTSPLPPPRQYAVVHQYDRHQRLLDTLLARYADDDDDSGEGILHPSFVEGYNPRLAYSICSRNQPSNGVLGEGVHLGLEPFCAEYCALLECGSGFF